MYERRSKGEGGQEGERLFYVEKAAEILLRFDFPTSIIWKGMGNWSVNKVLAYERHLGGEASASPVQELPVV